MASSRQVSQRALERLAVRITQESDRRAMDNQVKLMRQAEGIAIKKFRSIVMCAKAQDERHTTACFRSAARIVQKQLLEASVASAMERGRQLEQQVKKQREQLERAWRVKGVRTFRRLIEERERRIVWRVFSRIRSYGDWFLLTEVQRQSYTEICQQRIKFGLRLMEKVFLTLRSQQGASSTQDEVSTHAALGARSSISISLAVVRWRRRVH